MACIPFREYHLLQLLNHLSPHSPLDETVSTYFQTHKALGSKDRREIANTLYLLIRWQELIDYFLIPPMTWEKRVETLKALPIDLLSQDTSLPDHIQVSFKKELYDILFRSLGENTKNFCLASNTEAPITIRINPEKITVEEFAKRYPQSTRCKHAPFGFTFPKREPFTSWEDFKEGLFEMQDEGSQLLAELIDAKPHDEILDYCAGSGGKSLAFAYKLQKTGKIFLHDIREKALLEAEKRLNRAGIHNKEIKLPCPQSMDWILIDAPCSATGTLRRHPDLKQKITKTQIDQLVQEQRKIFKEAYPLLKPTGKIVYATCSVLKEENEEQLAFFLENYPLTIANPPFHSLPKKGEMDGFYGVILQFNTNSSIMTS